MERCLYHRTYCCHFSRFAGNYVNGGLMIGTARHFLLLLAIFVVVLHAAAQGEAPKPVEPAIDAVASQLRALTHLPADEWRYHAGDLPHGEDVALDDSSWTIVKNKSQAPEDAVWYRRWIEVPPTLDGYDLTGTKLRFQFAAYANDPITEIVYFNGRRVAMGEDLEPIILLDPVRAGDKVLIAIKLLQTVDKKHFDDAIIRVEFASSRPSPLDLLQEIESATALAPSLGTKSQSVEEGVERAAKAVDLAALGEAKQQAFDASLKKAHALLLAVKPDLQGTSVRLTGNAHIDAAWLWPWTETVDVVRHTFGTALQLMHEYPQYTYTQSAAAYNQWMEEKYPSLHRQIVDRVKEGRWEMVGGMWVEPDLNMPDGESLVRQLLVGKRYFKEKYGQDVRIGWNPDSFGYTWQLPQIYKKSGFDTFVTQKMSWNSQESSWRQTFTFPYKLFWWQSPDGSRVLTYFPHGYNGGISGASLSQDIADYVPSTGFNEIMHLYGVGDHGGGPTRQMVDEAVRLEDPSVAFPKVQFSTARAFFDDAEKAITEGDLKPPVWNNELYQIGR